MGQSVTLKDGADVGQVAVALASALSVEDVLDVLHDLVPRVSGSDGLLLSLARGGDLDLVRWVGYSADALSMFRRVSLDAQAPLARTAAGASAFFLESREAYLVDFPQSVDLVASTGKQAWAFLPLVAGRQTFGTLLVSWTLPRSFASADRAQLLVLAGLASQALERARLLEGTLQVSVALQRALLPGRLRALPGVELAARYRPASLPEQVVGGDWYDAHAATDGWLAMSIGDVVGHDIHAAALMGEVRHTVRAFASEGQGPSGVLHRVNRLLAQEPPADVTGERMATCFYLVLDPTSGVGTAVRAGHPSPVLLRPGELPRLLEVQTSLPLGVLEDAAFVESSGVVLPGDVLVLFTDGLVEAHDVPVGEGIAALLAFLADVPASTDLEELADVVLATCSDSGDDDVALLLVRYCPDVPPLTEVTRRFADEAVSVPLARRFTTDVLTAWGAQALVDDVELVTTELVTNAVAHTVGWCDLTVRLLVDRVRIEVRDRSTRLPTDRPGVDTDVDAEGGRGLTIVRALSSAFGVEDHGTTKTVWAEIAR